MSEQPESLYSLCVNAAVADCVTVCRSCKKEFRNVPDNVLFDFYFKMYLEKRLCQLGLEFGRLEVFKRMLNVKHKRTQLLRCFQALVEHDSSILAELVANYMAFRESQGADDGTIDLGLRLGGFFSEGGWYLQAIHILDAVENIIDKKEKNAKYLGKLLDCYHKRIYVESHFCLFQKAEHTYKLTNCTIDKLRQLDAVPNLAGVYANYSTLFFMRSEYDEAYKWTQEAIKLLNNSLPMRIIINVLRQGSKSCVVKRKFAQAGILINQALALAVQLYAVDQHPQYSDVLMDQGFYLLNFDSIQESVRAYDKGLDIRKKLFEKNNIHVAVGLEDLAYAHYVNEYSSGHFYFARESAERAIRIMEKILPKDHLLLASAKRVKALILEEIALDIRETSNQPVRHQFFVESEQLHKEALTLSHKSFGENNVQTAKHYGNLGRLYQSMCMYCKAEKMHLKAIAIKEQLLGPNDYEVGLSLGHLASLYNYHMKRHHDAEKLYLRSIDIGLQLFGDLYSGLEYDYRGLIHAYCELQDIPNMIRYTQIMRDWKMRRECQKPTLIPSKPEPLADVIDKFFSLC